ncbi:PKD domain-containing protein, partial [Salinivirga cyanobacteriivorans]
MRNTILIILLSIIPILSSAQVDSIFWFVAPAVTEQHNDEPINLVISSTQDAVPTNVEITMPVAPVGAFNPINITLNGYETQSINLDARKAIVESRETGGQDLNGMLIVSDNPITAYYEVDPNNNRDIYSLKGHNGLGYEFWVPVQDKFNNHFGYTPVARNRIDIVATEDNTQIEIDLPVASNNHPAGTFTITLNRGETYSVVSQDENIGSHLGGTHITVTNDKAIAVTVSDDSVDSPSGGWDLLGDQLVPIETPGVDGELKIGQEYIVVRTRLTLADVDEYFFILATADNTQVEIDGAIVDPDLDQGETYAHSMTDATDYVNTSEPVYLFHVGGFGEEMGGALLPTIDGCKGSTRVSFTRTVGGDFFINLLVKENDRDGFVMEYEDGSTWNIPTGYFLPVPNTGNAWYYLDRNQNQFANGTGGGVPIGEVTTIYNTKGIFQLGLYNGTTTTGCKYGYFSDFKTNESAAVATGTNSGLIELCYGDSTFLRAQGGISYQWTSSTCPSCMEGDLTSNIIKVKPTPGSHKFLVEINNPCTGIETKEVTVNVDSLVQAYYTTSDPIIACDSLHVNTINNSIGASAGYNWYIDGVAFSSDAEPTLTYDNTGTEPDTINILLAAYRALCADAFERQAIIYPDVNADFTPIDTAGCSPMDITFNNTTSSTGNTYKWDFGDGNLAFSENPSNTFSNSGTTDDIFDVEMVATSPYNCKDTANQTVTVHPPVNADYFINKTAGCAPLEVDVTNLSSLATIDNLQWVWGDGDTSFINNPGSHIYQNTTAGNLLRKLKLEVFSSDGCQDADSTDILVYPQVSAGFDQDAIDICHGTAVQFTDTAIGPITSRKWDFSDGTVLNGVGDTTHVFQNFGDTDSLFTVYQIVEGNAGCKDTASIDILVHPAISAGFTSDKNSGCTDLDVNFLDQSLGPVNSYEWDWGDGSPLENGSGPLTHTYTNATSGTLLYTAQQVVFNAAGCSDTITQLFEVYPEPDATFTAAPLSGCNPLDVDFAHTPTNNVDVQLSWDFGDASSGSDSAITHTYQHFNTTTTTFDVELAVQTARGCKDTATTTVDVGPYYDIAFTLDTAQGCSPFTIRPTNTSSGGIDTWTWKKEDVVFSSAQSPAAITLYNTTNNPIDTVITLIGSNTGGACEDSMQRTVTIYPSVDATYIQDVDEGCNPLTVNFTHTPANNPAMSFNWDFDDNNSSALQNPSHTFVNNTAASKIYNVQLNVTSPYNCKDSANSVVTVGSYVEARMSVSAVSGCAPFQVEFEDISNGDVATRTWLRNGTSFSNLANPQIIINNNSGVARQDTIMLIVENGSGFGCTDTAQKIITIYPEVDATFNHPVTQGCNPLTVDFTHNPAFPIPVDYTWDFGDESSSNLANPTHTFNNQTESPRTYNIKLLVESQHGCKDSTYSSVEVASRLDAKFVMPAAAGCSPFSASFQDASVGDINSWQWYIDGNPVSSTSTASTTLNNTTNFNITQDVKLVVSNSGPGNCVDSVTKQITAYPEVTANFSQDTDRGCNPLPVNFTYEPGGNAVNVNHDWDFGDGTSSDEQDPPHNFEHFNYNGTTTFEVWHTTTSEYGCTDQQSSTVVVEKALKAEFAIDPSAGCNPFDATFVNTTQGADTYQWTFGDGDTYDVNVLQDVSHQYTNSSYTNTATFDAQLLVTNTAGNCRDSMTKTVSVYPNVRATYDLSSTEGCHPLTVDFTNTSLGSNNFYWDFDDQTSATVTNPTHTFTNFSSTNDVFYDVYLLATNDFECQDDTTATIRVNHLPKSQFTIDNTESCSPLEILAQNTSIGYDDFQWRLGNGETSSSATLNYTYNNTGNSTASYQLELFTQTNRGCTDSSSLLLNVYPNVSADFNIETDRGCNPLTTAFDNLSVNADNFYWDFGDGTTSNQQNPTNRFEIQGYTNQTIPVKLVAASDYECTDSITKNVTVYVQPAAEFEADPATQQYPQSTVTITDLTNGGPFSYQWSFGDGNTSTQMFPGAHTYDTWGTYTIDLSVVNNDFNCADNASESITIDPPVVTAEFNIDDTAGCVPHTVTFTAEASQYPDDNYDYLWDFGDGTSSTEQQPTHTFDSAATYPITLTVVGDNGAVNAAGSVKVYPLPEVSFTMEPRLLMIPGDQTQCYNLTQYASEYLWDFGDGSTSTDKN